MRLVDSLNPPEQVSDLFWYKEQVFAVPPYDQHTPVQWEMAHELAMMTYASKFEADQSVMISQL